MLLTVSSCLFWLCIVLVSVNSTSPPRWEKTYWVKGTLYIPYAEIEEPFLAWYDELTQRSRIDYYGGMVKTYQLANEGSYGTSLKIAPVTTMEVLNQDTCLQVNGTDNYKIEIQSILPDTREFKLIDKETCLGVPCDKFMLTEVNGLKKNVYTLWVAYVKSEKYPARKPVPVRYEMKGYNSLLGSHYDHYYLEYDSYSTDEIPNSVFEIDSDMSCIGFPGPGDSHLATFNPMKEFIHPIKNDHIEHEFLRFIGKHNKIYQNETEQTYRKNIFQQNLRFIHSKNRQTLGYSLAVNHLADRTNDELKALRGFRSSGIRNGTDEFPYNLNNITSSLPEQYDWRIQGAVTPVKDQSVCGSCWSFGTVGAIEGAYFLKNGENLVRLSQQALIDCSWGFGNNGCDGGEDFRAYDWMMKVGGIPTEEEYGPYLGQDGFCHIENISMVATIRGYVDVPQNSSNSFKLALIRHGPLSVAIDASQKTFTFYSHGLYYDNKCKNNLDGLDHAVLAVGYGMIKNEPYWLVKNSWSTYWGNDGYVLMSARDNNCGVMTSPTYVLMK